MKIYTKLLALLFMSMQVFASNMPGAFGSKMGAAPECKYPGVCVFYKVCLDEYQSKNPEVQLTFPEKDESGLMSAQAKIAFQNIAKDILFVADDSTPLEVNELGKIPGLIQTAAYQTWLKVLKNEEINSYTKITRDEPGVIQSVLQKKYAQLK